MTRNFCEKKFSWEFIFAIFAKCTKLWTKIEILWHKRGQRRFIEKRCSSNFSVLQHFVEIFVPEYFHTEERLSPWHGTCGPFRCWFLLSGLQNWCTFVHENPAHRSEVCTWCFWVHLLLERSGSEYERHRWFVNLLLRNKKHNKIRGNGFLYRLSRKQMIIFDMSEGNSNWIEKMGA